MEKELATSPAQQGSQRHHWTNKVMCVPLAISNIGKPPQEEIDGYGSLVVDKPPQTTGCPKPKDGNPDCV
jgi:hypothetical protein